MWEFFIVFNFEDLKYIKGLEQELNNLDFKVITAISSNSLSVACKYSLKVKLLEVLKPLIAEIILLIYKSKFYKKINNINLITEQKESLIKLLTIFNFEEEKQIIVSKLRDLPSLNIPSFYNFMLKDLQDRWQQIINLLNSKQLLNSETFLDILKLLLSFEPNNQTVIDVYFNDSKFFLIDENNNTIKLNFSGEHEIKLLVELISLNPKIINLHCVSVLSSNIFKIIYYVFNKKVNLLV